MRRGVFGEDFVQRLDGGINMRLLKDVGRQEAQHRVAGAVDENLAFEHFCDGQLRQVGRIEFGGDHQAPAADVDNGLVALGQYIELRLEVAADFGGVCQQLFLFDVVDDGDSHGASQRAATESRSVHAGMEGA